MSYFDDEGERRDQDNLRRERRWNIPVPVRVRGRRDDGAEFDEETITADACPTGMCILLTVKLHQGDEVSVVAPEEQFESQATVTDMSDLGPTMNRIRVRFPKGTVFRRDAAAKKYIYDYETQSWVGYISEGTLYNSKHEPFGKVEGLAIHSLTSGELLFRLARDRVFDPRMNCVGHLI